MATTVARLGLLTLSALFVVALLCTHSSADRDGRSAEEQLLASSETLRSWLMTPDIQQKLLLSAKQIAAINAAVIPPKSSIVPLAEAMVPFAPILVDWQIRALMPRLITSNGVCAFGTPEVQESLQLSDQQKLAIGAVLVKRRSDMEAVGNTEFSMQFLREVLEDARQREIREARPVWHPEAANQALEQTRDIAQRNG
jgi:hypothetical protein